MPEKKYPLPPKLDHRASTMDPCEAILKWLFDELDDQLDSEHRMLPEIPLEEAIAEIRKRPAIRDAIAKTIEKAFKSQNVQWAFEELLRREKEKAL